jgi:hypothetical protein
MQEPKIISGSTEQEIWPLIESDLNDDDLYLYNAIIKQGSKEVLLVIDIDPGGGFEGGSESTQLSAVIAVDDDFKFAIHHEGFFDDIGKFFGMEDIETGYADLDPHVVIKTNHPEKARELFSDPELRSLFAKLDNFDLGIHHRTIEHSDREHPVLEFNSDEGITDSAELRKIYHAFYAILTRLEA